jgi:hypothetical protein
VLEKERTFSEDINNDGFAGDPIASILDNDGYLTEGLVSYGLYRSQITKSYYIDDAGMTVGTVFTDTAMKIQKNPTTDWTPGKANIIGIAEKGSGHLEILMKSGTTFSAQEVNEATGAIIGAATNLTRADLDAREYYYEADLNGINDISLIGLTNPPSNWDN